jgi:hypothetical protein
MQANPEKFQAIAVGKKSFDKSPIFQIGTSNIACDEAMFYKIKYIIYEYIKKQIRELKPAEHLSVYLPMC